MNRILKHRLEISILLVTTIVYFLSRLLTLHQLPIFTDEAIYMRWAQIAGNDANWRFISLTDGKQPLFIWLSAICVRFVSDPLIAGRLVSVVAGVLTMAGLFLLGREVFRKSWIGVISAALYTIYPFALVYDRMALYDSLVGTFAVWGLYLTILLVRRLRSENAFLLSFAAGAAVLNKTSGFFILYLLPFALILLDWSKKTAKSNLIKFIGLAMLTVVITYAMYFILRLSPFFYIINEKNAVFIYPLKEWLVVPHDFIYYNFRGLTQWFLQYFGPVFLLLTVYSLLIKKYIREKILLLLWFIIPFVALAIFGKTIYPRYILFMTLSLFPLIAYAMHSLFVKYKNPVYRMLLILLVVSYPLIVSFTVIKDFATSFIPASDRNQYFASWPSGVGIKESLNYFNEQAKREKINIFTAGTFGLLPYAYEMYLKDNKNIGVHGFWPVKEEIPGDILKSAATQKTYVVFYQECPPCRNVGTAPASWPLKKVLQVERIEKNTFFTVYEIL